MMGFITALRRYKKHTNCILVYSISTNNFFVLSKQNISYYIMPDNKIAVVEFNPSSNIPMSSHNLQFIHQN